MAFSILTADKSPLPDWYLDTGAPWEEIISYVAKLREINPKLLIWEELEEKLLSENFIDELISQGWEVFYRENYLFYGSISPLPKKEITLRAGLQPYQRDEALFHELAHLRHPLLLSHQTARNHQEETEREIIVEWLAKQARANPELLRKAVVSFGMRPKVYDLSSYHAFNDLVQQPSLPHMDLFYITLMD